MDITKVSANVTNIEDYIKPHQQAHKTAPDSDVIVELSTQKSEKDEKLVTYADPKNMTNEQLWEHYTQFANKQIGKQLSGVKAYIQGFMDGSGNKIVDVENLEKQLWERYGINGDLNPVQLESGGKYSPENLSDSLVQFAKNLSGGDSSKADLLLDAVKKGFGKAEEVWGDELPEISQKTYDLTVEKFEAWKNENVSEETSEDATQDTNKEVTNVTEQN